METNGVVVDEELFPGRQGRLVFAHLVAEQGRPVPRDELAEALWGDRPPLTWDKALTVIVSKLRTLLNEHGVDGASALTGAFGCYRLELPEGTWVDVAIASTAAREAEEALAADDPERGRTAAELALSLVGEPFLPGEDGEWVEGKRRELGDVRARALSVLADASLRLGDPQAATKWAEKSIALAPYSETSYRRLMEAHVAAGNRAEALRVYERCRRLLAEELGTYPSPETEAIYREVLDAPSVRARPELEGAVASGGDADRPPRRGALLALAAAALLGGVAILTLAVAGVSPFSSGGAPTSASGGADAVDVVELSSHHPTGSVALAASPKAIAYGQDSIWATMPDQGAVARIDPKTETVEQTIGVGKGPAGVAVGGGFVWVANSLDGTVSQIDPRTNGGQVVNTIQVGNGPSGVAHGLGGVWVANSVDRTVQRIDPATGEAGRAITVEAGADAIAAGDGALWVTSTSAGILSSVDPRTGSVTATNVGNGPTAVAVGPHAVWVANGEDATVMRIDPGTNRVESPIPVGEGPTGVAVGPEGSVWVASELARTISKIDPAVGRVVQVVRVGGIPQGVAATADNAFVAVRGISAAHRGGTLRVAVANSAGVYGASLPKSLDPAAGYTAWELLTLTNDGLLGYGRSGGAESLRVVPDLASAMPTVSDGNRTYTFRLRSGIHYSNGALVRAADVRRGIERALLVGGDGPNSYLGGILGATGCMTTPRRCDLSRGIVTDPASNTVTFHLAAPDPDFLYKLALPLADAVPASTPIRPRLPLPATGPYKIASFDARRGVIRLVRNPRFHLWSAVAQPSAHAGCARPRLAPDRQLHVLLPVRTDRLYGRVPRPALGPLASPAVRVGVDLIEIPRIARALERYPGFRERCFTDAERAYCDSKPNPPQHYAARFAGKEAIGKALGSGVLFTWREIEIAGRPKPGVSLSGRTKDWAERVGAGKIELSMTHSRELAQAVCIVSDA